MHEDSHIVVDTQKHIHIGKSEKLSIEKRNHTRIYIFIEKVLLFIYISIEKVQCIHFHRKGVIIYIYLHRKSAIYLYILKICFDKFYISAFY